MMQSFCSRAKLQPIELQVLDSRWTRQIFNLIAFLAFKRLLCTVRFFTRSAERTNEGTFENIVMIFCPLGLRLAQN